MSKYARLALTFLVVSVACASVQAGEADPEMLLRVLLGRAASDKPHREVVDHAPTPKKTTFLLEFFSAISKASKAE